MKLQEFINYKEFELRNSGKYRDVKFSDAIDVKLQKNCVIEDFITTISDLDKKCEEIIELSSLSENPQIGSKITFDVIRKGKRKYESVKSYVIYT